MDGEEVARRIARREEGQAIELEHDDPQEGLRRDDERGLAHYAGIRHWTASLLPALLGTTLPFWLRPPGFAFRWVAAAEFVGATLLAHAGLSFLQARFEGRAAGRWTTARLAASGTACLVAAGTLGIHLNADLDLRAGVPAYILIAYGVATLFAGALYVAPPFRFSRRAGGEIVLAEGLGLVPVLGAYLVQAGDLTRTVYLAAMPMVAATWLWVWADELVTRPDDERSGRGTLVLLVGVRHSGRVITPALCLLLLATLLGTVVSRSLPIPSLVAVLSLGLAWKVASASWKNPGDPARMREARTGAFRVHLATGIVLAASPLTALGG